MKKKILLSLLIIAVIAGATIGITNAFLNDEEKSENNTVQTGTFDIDGEGTFIKDYSFSDIYPGQDPKEINFTLRNKGSLPMRVWMIIKNVNNEENSITASEQHWYNANGGAKNDVDSAIVYSLNVDGNLALEQEAGITVSQIKDYYINLVRTDQPFQENNGDGILRPGHTITVNQKFYLPVTTGNWAQSDIMNFEIEILAQQIDAQEPIKQLSFMNNKNIGPDWALIEDGRVGVLKYDSSAETFNYDFIGTDLQSGASYSLIYYADGYPGDGQHHLTGLLIDKGITNSEGKLILKGSKNIGTDLPNSDDQNYPYGAKVWLVNSSSYNEADHKINGWSPNTFWLFDSWPGLIRYKQNTDGSLAITETIHFSSLGASPQFGHSPYDNYDYSQANVSFTYNTPANDRLSGTLTATGLKPNMTYQVKFIGKPTCAYGASGNDIANEYIGYKGRWTCLDCSCSGAGCNRTDAEYEANKAKADTDPSKECIAGYLVWGYITADNTGAVSKTLETANSYHVLWCSGGTCGQSNNSQLNIQDPYPICAANDVNGQIERGSCNGLVLDPQSYDLNMVLTEESFHQSSYGTWTTVMGTDISFEIE